MQRPARIRDYPVRPGKARTESLQRVKLEGFGMVIAQLEGQARSLRRAARYLEE